MSILNHICLEVSIEVLWYISEKVCLSRGSMILILPPCVKFVLTVHFGKVISINQLGRRFKIHMRAELVFHLNRHFGYLLQLICHELHGGHTLQWQLIVALFYRMHLLPGATISVRACHAPLAERALAILAW